jgi:hypothetical protein
MTPVHSKSFAGQNGAVQPVANGQPTAPMNPGAASLQADSLQANFMGEPVSINVPPVLFTANDSQFDFQGLGDFNNNVNGNTDVLQDFDFDSFLHQDGDDSNAFNFDASQFLDTSEIGAE